MTYDNCSTPSCGTESSAAYVPYNRSLVHGIGRNDFPTPIRVNNVWLQSYRTWSLMLARCYGKRSLTKNPTYTGCTVVEDWHSFTAFEQWFTANYFEGACLDKDLLYPGNKVYAPNTCVFVDQALNKLLGSCAASRGLLPLGVSKQDGKFRSQVCENGVQRYLGMFPTALLAHQAWQIAKAYAISDFITDNPRIRKALDRRVAQLRDDLANNRITLSL